MRIFLLFGLSGLAACASNARTTPDAGIVQLVDPMSMAVASQGVETNYRIGRGDLLKISVFQVPDLSFDEIRVDASGMLQLPLVGVMRAERLTPVELSGEIQRRLGERYIRNPQVTVTVGEAASQKITVDGAVTKPGVYEMRGRTTLLQAVTMAEGTVRTANTRSVAVFRTVDERPMVAVFDLASIRAGQSADPVVLGDDIIVVDTSTLQVAIRDVIAALPGLAAFGYLR